MANECQTKTRATGCIPDPSQPVADRLAEVLPAVGVAVRDRMEAMGQFREGRCLTAAAVGVAELRAAGFRALFQAGSCYWRRIPASLAAERGRCEDGRECFGYEWEPDHPVSADAMRVGAMPSFHAWVAVVDGDQSAVVDFAAHWMPEAAASVGADWHSPKPPYPAVVSDGDYTPETGISYAATMEAIGFCLVVARNSFYRHAMNTGNMYFDLLAVVDPKSAGPVSITLPRLLQAVRSTVAKDDARADRG